MCKLYDARFTHEADKDSAIPSKSLTSLLLCINNRDEVFIILQYQVIRASLSSFPRFFTGSSGLKGIEPDPAQFEDLEPVCFGRCDRCHVFSKSSLDHSYNSFFIIIAYMPECAQ